MTTKRSLEISMFIWGQSEGEEFKMQTEKEWLERQEEIQERVLCATVPKEEGKVNEGDDGQWVFLATHYWHAGCYFPDQGSNLRPLQWKRGVLTTGPGSPMVVWFYLFIFYLKTYLFIWLCQVLVAARGIFVAACGIFSCSMWDLVP